MRKKHKDLQPWLDYFQMLEQYQERGLLQVIPDKHEAYVTHPAVHAMTEGDNPRQQLLSGAIARTARRIRTYAGWRLQQGEGYLSENFALHVVKAEEPHDPIYTIVIQPRRRKWPWQRKDVIEIITYDS